MNAMLIEDDPSARAVPGMQPRSYGFEVTAFPDAKTAWALCQREVIERKDAEREPGSFARIFTTA